jgi:hypothetical protein
MPFSCSGPHACYTDVFNEYIAFADRPEKFHHNGFRSLQLLVFNEGTHRWPTLIFFVGFELEHACQDPQNGELCLSGVKPEETLVVARSDTDVPFIRLTWV